MNYQTHPIGRSPGRGNRELWWLIRAFDTAARLRQPVGVFVGWKRTGRDGRFNGGPNPYHVRSLWARMPRGTELVAIVHNTGDVSVTSPEWRSHLGLPLTTGRFA